MQLTNVRYICKYVPHMFQPPRTLILYHCPFPIIDVQISVCTYIICAIMANVPFREQSYTYIYLHKVWYTDLQNYSFPTINEFRSPILTKVLQLKYICSVHDGHPRATLLLAYFQKWSSIFIFIFSVVIQVFLQIILLSSSTVPPPCSG